MSKQEKYIIQKYLFLLEIFEVSKSLIKHSECDLLGICY